MEFKLLTLDLKTEKISKQSSDLSWCSAIIGPWINDDFIAVEYLNGTPPLTALFYKYNSNNWNSKGKIFEDKEYQYRGPITLSPDNKNVTYPVGDYTFGSSGKVNMRIRNLQTQSYIDVLSFIINRKEFIGNKIFYAKWDSESTNLYFTLTNDEGNNSLVRFNIDSKEPYIVVPDATDTDIN